MNQQCSVCVQAVNMYHLKVIFVIFLVPTAFAIDHDIWSVFTKDNSIWKCVTNLNEECVMDLGKRPVRELFNVQELRLGEHVSIEKVSNVTSGKRDMVENVWDLGEMANVVTEYLTSHALKLKLGNLEGRLFKSPKKEDSMELTVEARKRDGVRSQKIYRVIIPLVIGFKITGLVIFGIVAVKFFLLKASLVANTALLVAGGIVMKKLYDHGMGMLTHHQSTYMHHAMPNFYANGQDFSGFGYNGYSGNSFADASSQLPEVTDPVLGEPDLHGQFSNHAIALAALNKTLMQQQQQPSQHLSMSSMQMPKRRWSHKWSPWQSHR